AFVNGDANSTVAVSPTEYRVRSGMTSILNCDSSFHGTQSFPEAQRTKLVVAARPLRSAAVYDTMYVPPSLGVNVHGTALSAVIRLQWATVSDTQSPMSSDTPFRSRRTLCHSRRTIVPCTLTPGTFCPFGRTAITPTDCGVPASQK